jgi:hypothetical protein
LFEAGRRRSTGRRKYVLSREKRDEAKTVVSREEGRSGSKEEGGT